MKYLSLEGLLIFYNNIKKYIKNFTYSKDELDSKIKLKDDYLISINVPSDLFLNSSNGTLLINLDDVRIYKNGEIVNTINNIDNSNITVRILYYVLAEDCNTLYKMYDRMSDPIDDHLINTDNAMIYGFSDIIMWFDEDNRYMIRIILYKGNIQSIELSNSYIF